jgi:hypothetical protein
MKIAEKDSEAEITERSVGFGLKAVFISTPETRAGYREDRDGDEVMKERVQHERTNEKKKA